MGGGGHVAARRGGGHDADEKVLDSGAVLASTTAVIDALAMVVEALVAQWVEREQGVLRC